MQPGKKTKRAKTLHHTVWRFHLRAWAPKDQIFCLQDREIFPSNLKGVAAEKGFYKVHELTSEDISFLQEFLIKESPEGLKASHEHLVNLFTLPHRLMNDPDGQLPPEAAAQLRQMIMEMNESIHGYIEDTFKPYLKALRSNDVSFLSDPKSAAQFYYSIAVQYLRTNFIVRAAKIMDPRFYDMYKRVGNVFVHITATNIGHAMFASRGNYTNMLLNNRSNVPFVTADQPVINLAANPKEIDPPQKFELYYPLSPDKALLILEPSSDYLPDSHSVSEMKAHHYNLLMAAHSHRQVLSNSKGELEAIRNELPAFLSCL